MVRDVLRYTYYPLASPTRAAITSRSRRLILRKESLLDTPILYLSRYITEHKPTYYELLQRVRTEGAWEQWIRFMLTAVENTARLTLDTANRIVAALEETTERARQQMPRSTYSKELIEAIFVQPYVKIEHLVRAGIAERRTASKYLKQLEELGVLESYKAWRETIYLNTRLMEVIREPESGAAWHPMHEYRAGQPNQYGMYPIDYANLTYVNDGLHLGDMCRLRGVAG
jgi:hypothetical protein